MSNFSLALSRETLQLSFRPTLNWFATRSESASILESKYQEWGSDDNGNIALYSPDSKEALEVYTTHITHIREANFDSPKNMKDIISMSESLSEHTDINFYRRVGYRATSVYSSKFQFDEIVDMLNQKLFVSRDKQPQEGQVVDLAYIFDTLSDGYKIHTQLGAVKSEEGLKWFKAKFSNGVELKTDNNLFFDIDVSISSENEEESINVTDLNGVLSTLEEKRDICIENYLTVLGNK